MKQTLVLFLLLIAAYSQAQFPKGEKPDYKQIKAAIENKKLESYYPKLVERMKNRDTTLVASDFRNLYYGYVFQKEYNPYGRNSQEEALEKFFANDTLVPADYEPLIKVANKALEENPFDLKIMNMLGYVYHLNKDEAMSGKMAYFINNILETIIKSGDGLTCETAFHVISVDNEYSVLAAFELEGNGQALTGNCDYLNFEKGQYKIDGLYFDITKMMESLKGKYQGK